MKRSILIHLFMAITVMCYVVPGQAQNRVIEGKVFVENSPLEFAHVIIKNSDRATATDSSGLFFINELEPDQYTVLVTAIGYGQQKKVVDLYTRDTVHITFDLEPTSAVLDQVVVSGTMKEVSRLDSPVP